MKLRYVTVSLNKEDLLCVSGQIPSLARYALNETGPIYNKEKL